MRFSSSRGTRGVFGIMLAQGAALIVRAYSASSSADLSASMNTMSAPSSSNALARPVDMTAFLGPLLVLDQDAGGTGAGVFGDGAAHVHGVAVAGVSIG